MNASLAIDQIAHGFIREGRMINKKIHPFRAVGTITFGEWCVQ